MRQEEIRLIKASIVGVTGYAGIELYRLLRNHPQVELNHLVSHSHSGEKLSEVYPQYGGEDVTLSSYDTQLIAGDDVVFTALPHGVSQEKTAELREKGVRVIDLSGDFRYRESDRYEEWYDETHAYPELLFGAVYGLVELNRSELEGAELVANPGCYPTASLLGLLPLVNEDLLQEGSVIIDAKSGVSGAGRKVKQITQYTEVDESLKAYGIAGHRHTSEIEAVLEEMSGQDEFLISFTPHLAPYKRGILATIYGSLSREIEEKELTERYQDFYRDDYFVRILDGDRPEPKYVAGSNFCHLGVNVDSRVGRVIIVSAIDNLGKGAAGQAVQNMNVMFSLSEEMGLEGVGMFP